MLCKLLTLYKYLLLEAVMGHVAIPSLCWYLLIRIAYSHFTCVEGSRRAVIFLECLSECMSGHGEAPWAWLCTHSRNSAPLSAYFWHSILSHLQPQMEWDYAMKWKRMFSQQPITALGLLIVYQDYLLHVFFSFNRKILRYHFQMCLEFLILLCLKWTCHLCRIVYQISARFFRGWGI